MKKSKLQKFRKGSSCPHFLIVMILLGFATNAAARLVTPVPEPSMLSLFGAGAIIAVIIYRMRGGK